jgi:hypothetical protein
MHVRTLALIAAFFLPLPVMADVTYTYTGNNFTTVGTSDSDLNQLYSTSPYNSSNSVSGWLSLPDALPANIETNFQLLSYSFSDGLQTISSANGAMGSAELFYRCQRKHRRLAGSR